MTASEQDIDKLRKLIKDCYTQFNGITSHLSKQLTEFRTNGDLYDELKEKENPAIDDIMSKLVIESGIKAELLLAKLEALNKILCYGEAEPKSPKKKVRMPKHKDELSPPPMPDEECVSEMDNEEELSN